MSHTTKKLRAEDCYIFDIDGYYVASTEFEFKEEEEEQAIARRLVACWNYCIGMSTEHLEAGDDWKVEARALLNHDKMVEAVKHCRAMTGWDLKKALDEVKLLQSGHQRTEE